MKSEKLGQWVGKRQAGMRRGSHSKSLHLQEARPPLASSLPGQPSVWAQRKHHSSRSSPARGPTSSSILHFPAALWHSWSVVLTFLVCSLCIMQRHPVCVTLDKTGIERGRMGGNLPILFKETRKELRFVYLHGSLMGIAHPNGLARGTLCAGWSPHFWCIPVPTTQSHQYMESRISSTGNSCDCLHQDKKGSKINKYLFVFYASRRKETNRS